MSDVVYRSEEAAAIVETQYKRVLEQWPVPKTELHVPTRQGSTFVVACGPESAPPVVLLHGSQANSAAWVPDVGLWSTKFRLFAIDMIGEPGFSARVRPDLAGDAHALWLDDVFEGLGLGAERARVAIVGTSLGGWLALDYARRRPAAIRALALICPAGIGRQKNLLLKVLPLLLFGSWGKRRIWKLVFGPAPKVLPQALQPLAELMESVGRAVKPRMLHIPQLTDAQLGEFDMPILTIIGGRDVLLDSQDTRDRLQRVVPHAEVCFIEDGYHFLPDLAPRVMEFLERSVLPVALVSGR
ncbi:alpha/beta fold hydrolase [Pseudomonas aeruginosa]|uniref:alpha/beta fold hydrolase n=1 Tax=Pseudomonas aeruginosa TaxID=287 RepID=UPI0005BD377E|nr:alpha/beta hydrolase [Pseudomonas aeruginosa]KAA5626192.1 alpha/beta hydrolase [Pseudomonas aeruginosa]KAA5648185.1 alpha/beta hydrolase [Pseudomonas aeruginosa]KAB5471725.1 alpha/beta hydrolase [Pseudomonas aeruginosa]KSE08768.1 carboxylesterase [Pseudomonas aeruginosa]WBJ82803.1 putative carboxylesterase nap [Pseudomonas aeruginosa]